MSLKDYHPARDWQVVVYHCPDAENRQPFVAFFDRQDLPICFWGSTCREVHDAAVRWRDDAVEANEARYRARVAALEKGRARRKAQQEPA